MPAARDPKLLIQVARLYYMEQLSQEQVASKLGISRSNVSRILTDAQRQGIVEIKINDPAGRERTLERQIEETFGLREARVAQGPGSFGPSRGITQVGVLASQVLLDSVKDQMTVALSWGQALQAMVWATTAARDRAAQLVQLVGGLSSIANEISGQELVRELASRLGASYRYLHAPAALATKDSLQALLAEQSIAQALEAARTADLAFVGIGTPTHGSSSAILESLRLSHGQAKQFWSQSPVGDIAARYFDHAGQPVRGAVDDRILAVTLADLTRIPMVVGVAEGRAKVPGVLGALHGHLIDVLVCDESLARGVLATAVSAEGVTT